MTSLWVTLQHVVHFIEELTVPLPSSRTVAIVSACAVPVVVLLHETSERWVPKAQIPILTYFRREWRKDPRTKSDHVTLLRNLVIFAWAAAMLHDNPDASRRCAFEFVADRVASETARKNVNLQIIASRRAAFEAAQEVVATAGLNDSKINQLMDAEIRRRSARESKRRLTF